MWEMTKISYDSIGRESCQITKASSKSGCMSDITWNNKFLSLEMKTRMYNIAEGNVNKLMHEQKQGQEQQ